MVATRAAPFLTTGVAPRCSHMVCPRAFVIGSSRPGRIRGCAAGFVPLCPRGSSIHEPNSLLTKPSVKGKDNRARIRSLPCPCRSSVCMAICNRRRRPSSPSDIGSSPPLSGSLSVARKFLVEPCHSCQKHSGGTYHRWRSGACSRN